MARRWAPGPVVAGTSSSADSVMFLESLMLAGSGIKRLHVNMTGTNMTLANITRLTLRAASRPIIDCAPWAMRAILGQVGKKAEYGTTATRFTLPLDLAGAAAPAGAPLRLDITKNATPATSTHRLGYTVGDETPSGYNMILGSSMNVAASQNNQPYAFRAPVPGAVLLGIALEDVANLTLFRLYANGGLVLDFSAFQQMQEVLEIDRGTTAVAELYLPLPAVTGAQQFQAEVSTGGSWGGVARELVAHWLVPAAA